MKSLRYWLGLPLFNLLLLLLFFFPFSVAVSHALYYCVVYGGLVVFPLATALYYPVTRTDCLPCRKTVVVSYIVLLAASYLIITVTGLLLQDSVFSDWRLNVVYSMMIATQEIIGYSIGLGIAKLIFR